MSNIYQPVNGYTSDYHSVPTAVVWWVSLLAFIGLVTLPSGIYRAWYRILIGQALPSYQSLSVIY